MQKALTQMNIQLANVISDQKGEALSASSFALAMIFVFFRAIQKPKCRAFVNCDVVSFIALDEILRLCFSGMVGVTFKSHIGNDFLHDNAANSTCFRVPFDVITTLERIGHL